MSNPAAALKGFQIAVPIVKIDRAKREVWGAATVEELDRQGEIVDYDAAKRAFSKWMGEFQKATAGRPPEEQSLGNLREMHQPISVGKAIAIKFDDAKKTVWLGGKLSTSPDGENAWTKVNEGILTGFSIGAPTAQRVTEYEPKTMKKVSRVVDFELSEVSLVDNPACPSARIHEVKLAKGMLDTIPEDAAPSGDDIETEDAAPVAPRIENNAFVDDDGRVWKMVDGRIRPITEEKNMTTPTKVEKKDIGPVRRTGSSPAPGPDTPSVAEGDTTLGVSPSGEGSSEKSVPPAGAAHQSDETVLTVPDGQGGKAAAAPPFAGQPGAQVPAAPAPQRFQYCAMCGGKLAGTEQGPQHGGCAQPAPAPAAPPHQPTPAAPAQPVMRAADSDPVAGLQKAFGDHFAGFQKAVLDSVEKSISPVKQGLEELTKRVTTIEKTPLPGGPMRTALPEGVRPVEKGAAGNADEVGVEKREQILAAAAQLVTDPFTRDKISVELAKSAATRAFRERGTKVV